jgi:hypothetical protein
MEDWFNELKDNSHRDQLSFNYVSWKNQDVKVKYLDKYIYKSSYFFWNGRHNKNNITNNVRKVPANNTTKGRTSVSELKKRLDIMKDRNRLKTYRVGLY